MLIDRRALIGNTVHVMPLEGGHWGVVDPRRHLFTMPSREAAVKRAKSVAEAIQPSQVVLLDQFGRLIPIARYQLPEYPPPQAGGSVFEAAVKSLLIGGLIAAGVAVLGDVVEKVDKELERETSKSRKGRKGR